MVVPTHPHAVSDLALHARQSIGSTHSLVKRLVKAKSLVDVLNCLIRFKDINVAIRLTIRGVSVDGEIASIIRHLRPRTAAILVVQRLEIRPLGLSVDGDHPDDDGNERRDGDDDRQGLLLFCLCRLSDIRVNRCRRRLWRRTGDAARGTALRTEGVSRCKRL